MERKGDGELIEVGSKRGRKRSEYPKRINILSSRNNHSITAVSSLPCLKNDKRRKTSNPRFLPFLSRKQFKDTISYTSHLSFPLNPLPHQFTNKPPSPNPLKLLFFSFFPLAFFTPSSFSHTCFASCKECRKLLQDKENIESLV